MASTFHTFNCMCTYIWVSVSRPTLSRVLIAQQESISCCVYNIRVGKFHGNLSIRHTQCDISHVIAHISLQPTVSPEMGWAQSLWGSWRSIWQNPSAPTSWQQPLLPSLISPLPAGLGIRNIFLRYEDSWQGKANCREEERDRQYVSVCVHLYSAWDHCLQAADHGDQRALQDLSCLFAILCYPFPSCPCKPWILQPKLNCSLLCGETWMLDNSVQQLLKKNWEGMRRRIQWQSLQQEWFW